MNNTNNFENTNHSDKNTNTPPITEKSALPRHRIKTDFFDIIAMILNFILTFTFIYSTLFATHSSWKTSASYLGIFALATIFIVSKQKKINAQAIFTGILCIASSLSFALRENPYEIHVWIILMLIYLSGSYCIALTNSNRYKRGSYFFLLDVLKTEVILPIKHLFLPYAAMHNTRKAKTKREDKKIDKKYIAVIVGILCAIPVLLIVIPLLIKSDAAFESIAGSFFGEIKAFFSNFENQFKSFFNWFNDNVIAFYLFLTVLVAPYIFSVMFSFRHSVARNENTDTSKYYEKLRFGSPALFSGFLGVICLVYVIYILSQTAYFFSAFGGKLPDGTSISIAQYARRGFFELAGIAAVNLVLIAVTVIFSRRNKSKFSVVIKAFDLFLCIFNILLSAISMSKILLYMTEMGLTHKRIYVLLIDFIFIVSFLCVAIRLFSEKFPYMRVITSTICVLLTVLSLIGIDNIIAEYNTEKYLNGQIKCNSMYEVFDGDRIGNFESCVKIAESKKELNQDAAKDLTTAVYRTDNGLYSYRLKYNGEAFELFSNDSALNIDVRKALNFAKKHSDTIIKALDTYQLYSRNDFELSIFVSNNVSFTVKSIGITLCNKETNKCVSSVMSFADGSPLDGDAVFNFGSDDEFTFSEDDLFDIEFEVTDVNQNSYHGKIADIYIDDCETFNLFNKDEKLFIAPENSDKGSSIELYKN